VAIVIELPTSSMRCSGMGLWAAAAVACGGSGDDLGRHHARSTAVVDICLWEEDLRVAAAVHLMPLIRACRSWSLGRA
jgi:hypothetical protein